MDFLSWTERYGIESARNQFKLSSHAVFVIRPGKFVEMICGNWRGSEPLSGQSGIKAVMAAKQRLREAINHCFATEETL